MLGVVVSVISVAAFLVLPQRGNSIIALSVLGLLIAFDWGLAVGGSCVVGGHVVTLVCFAQVRILDDVRSDGMFVALGACARVERHTVLRVGGTASGDTAHGVAGGSVVATVLLAPRFVDCVVPFALHLALGTAALCLGAALPVILGRVSVFLVIAAIGAAVCYSAERRRRENLLLHWRIRGFGVCVLCGWLAVVHVRVQRTSRVVRTRRRWRAPRRCGTTSAASRTSATSCATRCTRSWALSGRCACVRAR